MKKTLKITGITILVCTLLFTFLLVNNIGFAGTTSYSNASKIYSFGDNYSDSGESSNISSKLVANSVPDSFLLPAEPSKNLYWQGRWSDGSTAVEVLSQKLNVTLTNYAVGGAKSGTDNYYSWLVDGQQKTGLLGQIDKFKADLSGKSADSEALYFIFASANDYFFQMDYSNSGTLDSLSSTTVNNISTAVSKLKDLGAKKFMVVNSADLSVVPWEVISSRTDSASTFTKGVNTKLPVALNNLKDNSTTILLYDYAAISNKIRSNPSSYNLSEIIRPYQRTYPDIVKGVGSADKYYFLDEWNPTKTVHAIIGDDMSKNVITTFKK